jgi:hypothetical protein
MELVLWSPALIGLAVAAYALIHTRRVLAQRRSSVPMAIAEEPPNPFELGPPTVSTDAEGTIPAHPAGVLENAH